MSKSNIKPTPSVAIVDISYVESDKASHLHTFLEGFVRLLSYIKICPKTASGGQHCSCFNVFMSSLTGKHVEKHSLLGLLGNIIFFLFK